MHSRLSFPDEHTCAVQDCLLAFENSSKLQKHADENGHKAFRCQCDKAYTKLCSLTRHIKEAVEQPRYECPVESHWEGPKSPFRSACRYIGHVRLGHLEAHLRNIHKKTPAEVEAIVRPLRKRKLAVTPPPSTNNASTLNDATTTAVTCGQHGATPGDSAALSNPVGDNSVDLVDVHSSQLGAVALEQAGPAVTTTGFPPPGSLIPYQSFPMGIFGVAHMNGNPTFPASDRFPSPVLWSSTTGYGNAMATGVSPGPVDVLAGTQDAFGLYNTSTPPAPGYGYGQANVGDMTWQQSECFGHGAGVFPENPLHNPVVQNGLFTGSRPLVPAPLSGYDQLGHVAIDAQQGVYAVPPAFYPGGQAGYYAAPGGSFAALPPMQPAPLIGYGQAAHGGMNAQQNTFLGLAGGHNMTSGPAGYPSAALHHNSGVGAAGYCATGGGFSDQGPAAMPFAIAGGEAVSGLALDEHMAESSKVNETVFDHDDNSNNSNSNNSNF